MKTIELFQWDLNRSIEVPSGSKAHFASVGSLQALVVMEQGGKASVPNILLQEPKDINVWIVRDGATADSGKIRITSRPVPSDYVYTETDVETVETLTQAMVAAIESEIAHAEAQIAAAKAQADEATQTANQAITQAQETHKIAEADIAENRQLRETLKAEEAKRATAETNRKAEETKRVEAEAARKSAEATRAANETKRTETFNSNLVSWNSKVDAACKKATDTASKAAQDVKTATDAAIAQTQEATNAAVAKAQTATDNATTAANKAEAAVSKLPLPLGNTLKGEVESTMVSVHDAYPAPLVTTKVMGQSNQQQEPAPSPENPQEIANLNKAEIVVTGRNLAKQSTTSVNAINRYSSCLFIEADLMPSTNYVLSFNDVVGNRYYINEDLFENFHAFTTKSGRNIVKLSTKANISKTNIAQYISLGWIILKNDKNQDKAPDFKDVQLEYGDTATAYEPHKSKSTPIDLKGNELCSLPNGVKDEVVIDAEGNVSLIKRLWKLSRRIGDMNNWEDYPGWKFTDNELKDNVGTGIDTYINGISSHFQRFSANTIDARYGGTLYISKMKQSELIAKYPDEVVVFLGERKVPQTIPLGKVELPALPEATSNVWNDGNIPANVYINYLKDVNIAYKDLENQIKQITAALSMIDTPTVIPEMAWGTPAAI